MALIVEKGYERITVQDFDEWSRSKPDLTVPRVTESGPRPVETIDLERDDAALAALSRERLAVACGDARDP